MRRTPTTRWHIIIWARHPKRTRIRGWEPNSTRFPLLLTEILASLRCNSRRRSCPYLSANLYETQPLCRLKFIVPQVWPSIGRCSMHATWYEIFWFTDRCLERHSIRPIVNLGQIDRKCNWAEFWIRHTKSLWNSGTTGQGLNQTFHLMFGLIKAKHEGYLTITEDKTSPRNELTI